jgi:prevent-host-death family protein
MKAAGVREVKNHLSRYLRLVSEGEVVLITDRGEVVAQLAPPPTSPSRSDDEELSLERLARLGRLRLGRGRVVSADSHVADPELEGVDLAQVLADIRSDR